MLNILSWIDHKDLIRPGIKAILGNVPVGKVEKYRGKFKAICKLPSSKTTCGYYSTEEGAKKAINKVVMLWIISAGLTTIESKK